MKKIKKQTVTISICSLFISVMFSCSKAQYQSELLHPKTLSTNKTQIEIPKEPTFFEPEEQTQEPLPTEPTETIQPPVDIPEDKKIPLPPPPQPVPAPKPPVTTTDSYKFLPLAWELKTAKQLPVGVTPVDVKRWSQHIYNTIAKEESQMLGQNVADDVEIFCPKYRSLNDKQRLNFWGQFFAAVSYFESSWDPTVQFVEKTQPLDPVTGKPTKSEGLLQLSYKDQKNYRMSCGFSYTYDKLLTEKDRRRSILDPYKNLRCGIKIMATQLKKYRKIGMSLNVYWAVLKTNGAYTKVPQISKMTQQLGFCK